MATMFDLRKVLKQISNVHLQQFFATQGELLDVPWNGLKEHEIAPIVEAIQVMSPVKRRQVQILLKSFVRLSNNAGLKVLLEELQERHPSMIKDWEALKRRLDKVVWTYLNARDAFEEAVVFARADSLTTTRYWQRWPAVPHENFVVTEQNIAAFKAGLSAYYKEKELRGEHCEIHHYTRQNGAEYLFAYLPDWPDNFMVFNDDGELHSLDVPTAFTNLFVYTPATGALEMIAAGGKPVQKELRRLFCQGMLGISNVADVEPERPAYFLDHLLDPGFKFTWEPSDRIETVQVSRLLVVPTVEGHDLDGLGLRFRLGLPWAHALDNLDALLASRDLSRSQVNVEEVRIRVQLMGDGERRGRVLTINVTPRSCDLKSKDDEDLRILGEKCLRAWGIDHA
ncbi:MAG: hypothetical protein KatS3mg109_0662 [Pirellulaceae bacterium]|nr:MAG: hypothetical protein KatS3mg109_0662 [Pirellulaceae bacterium]